MDAVKPQRKRHLPTCTGYKVELHGKLFQFKRLADYDPPPCGPGRGVIETFSQAARLRLLKFGATIDYDHHDFASFITLTYPDECLPRDYKRRTIDRHLFLRKLETFLGFEVHGIWRTEWVPRKTGVLKGRIEPHCHLLLWGIRFIPWQKVRIWWQAVLHHQGYVRTEIKRAKNQRQVGGYLSKYIAKKGGIVLLSMLHNSTTLGRSYGFVRKSKIPRLRSYTFDSLPGTVLEALKDLALDLDPYRDRDSDESFILLGGRADVARRILAEYLLTTGEVIR